MSKFTAKYISSIKQIEPSQWQNLFDENYPFTRPEFLAALEDSGCTTAEKGWQVQHFLVYLDDKLVGAMPCYIKTHSYGEYIFDWSWADAYHKHGLEYYPKIVCAIPYTPATGSRLGIDKNHQHQTTEIIVCINQMMQTLASQIKATNWQCLFPEKALSDQLSENNWLQRMDVQFHWFNRNYDSFEDFTDTFASRKRKNVTKERRQVSDSNVEVMTVEGADISDEMWQRFFVFYQMTYLKRSRHGGYLNLELFLNLAQSMPQHMMMVVATSETEIVASALYFKSADTLFGRYWGCIEKHQFLHFECCYYQGIEYCIKHQLSRFDAGAQGEHKIQRGFEPITTYANYHILHPQFGPAIANFIEDEKVHNQRYIEAAKNKLPFKK
jgi:predicted N-acyltransferase